MTDSNEEMLSLLREIRDLQKRHFERYVKFTDEITAGQARAEQLRQEEVERAAQDTATALAEQRAMGRIVRRAEWMTPVIALLFGLMLLLILSPWVLQTFLFN